MTQHNNSRIQIGHNLGDRGDFVGINISPDLLALIKARKAGQKPEAFQPETNSDTGSVNVSARNEINAS